MKTLGEEIDAMIALKRAAGRFHTQGVACQVIQAMALEDPDRWMRLRDEIALQAITSAVQRRLTSLANRADSRQGWLALPEFERIPQLIEVEGGVLDLNEATLQEYRESESQLAKRIQSYAYPRRSDEKLKRDKERLAQMRRLDRRVAPLMAGDPEIKIRQGIEAYDARRETPAGRRNRKGGKARQRLNRKSTT